MRSSLPPSFLPKQALSGAVESSSVSPGTTRHDTTWSLWHRQSMPQPCVISYESHRGMRFQRELSAYRLVRPCVKVLQCAPVCQGGRLPSHTARRGRGGSETHHSYPGTSILSSSGQTQTQTTLDCDARSHDHKEALGFASPRVLEIETRDSELSRLASIPCFPGDARILPRSQQTETR